MFRMWGKIWKDNRIIQDTVYEDSTSDSRTKKVLRGLEEICGRLDLANPVWLKSNEREFQMHAKTRFSRDNFIEEIAFDYLELQVIEED